MPKILMPKKRKKTKPGKRPGNEIIADFFGGILGKAVDAKRKHKKKLKKKTGK